MSGRIWSKFKKMVIHPNGNEGTQFNSLTTTTTVPSTSNSSSSSAVSSSRISSSFRHVFLSKKRCSICWEKLKSGQGQGQAIFIAECSHSFHFTCISNNVKHGNHSCPLCRCKWKDIPFQPNFKTTPNNNLDPQGTATDPLNFDDDEPLPLPAVATSSSPSILDKVTIKTFTEFPAVAATHSVPSFPVLIRVCAPALPVDQRVPVDLVVVLDVSGSMSGPRLSLLKCATCFLVDHMLPCDRLSVVAFSSDARRILPLRKMTDDGRQDAKSAINLLQTNGHTNIVAGLNKGAKVLEERRESNPVSSILLLSDGVDTVNGATYLLNRLAASIFSASRKDTNRDSEHQFQSFTVHTFGVGVRHDSVTLNAISDASGGTFSFVESPEMIPGSFARCVGGIFSVSAQDVRLTVTSASPGVEIKQIPSGRHKSEINSEQKQAVIYLGDLYAEEKKDFLVHLTIPVCSDAAQGEMVKTGLVHVICDHLNALSNEAVEVDGGILDIRRPDTISAAADTIVSLEVDRERNRIMVAEVIGKAKEIAETGNLEGAKEVLMQGRDTLRACASAQIQSGDDLINMLESDLSEISRRMANQEMYDTTGRAYILSGLSSHSTQRATTRSQMLEPTGARTTGGAAPSSYDTPTMTSWFMSYKYRKNKA